MTSLVAQMVKCLPTMKEMEVQSLGWGDLLEKETTAHSSIPAWKILCIEEHEVAKSPDTTEQLHFHFPYI